MSAYFRIMVKGEDHMEFCYNDDISENKLDEEFDKAEEAYPNAQDIWVEKMD